MANSHLNKVAQLLLAMLLCAAVQAADFKKSTANIEVESDGAEVDARTKQMVLPKVRISQAGYAIQADEARATGLNFENSLWTFTGNVRITTPEGSSMADKATVQFRQQQIAELHMTGKPATFEQHDAANLTLAQGRAELIDYDLQKNTVRLTQDAWVKYGQNEFTGNTVVYDILNQRVLANQAEQQGERVRITINPNTGKVSTPEKTPDKTTDKTPGRTP